MSNRSLSEILSLSTLYISHSKHDKNSVLLSELSLTLNGIVEGAIGDCLDVLPHDSN